jgi:glucose-1-phosphate adenylyltransferase
MNYLKMIEYHESKQADLTIATMNVPLSEANRFGIMTVNEDNRIVRFQEKPAKPESTLASMGVYVFNTEMLLERLEQDAKDPESTRDFGKNIIPHMIESCRVFNYVFEGYWRDVGTVQSFLDANMDMLNKDSGLDIAAWGVRTNLEERNVADRPPSKLLKNANVSNSVLSRGCVIDGTVERSILSPGVRVEQGAVVRNSVIMHDCKVLKGAIVNNVVSDKDVEFGAHCQIGMHGENIPNQDFPEYLNTGISIFGKDAMVPAEVQIERNCVIYPAVTAEHYAGKLVKSGQSVGDKSL